ncbi:hypothetical protein H8D29_03145 [PVC group bacterium]|nr:hypothetical protein [PVC group bacterium]
MRAIGDMILVLFLSIFASPTFGEGLQLYHSVGGATNTLLIDGDYWYQGVGDRLLVLDKRSGKQVAMIQVSLHRAAGVCSDIIVQDGRLWVLLDGQEVVEMTVSEGAAPTVVTRTSAAELGIIPRGLSVVENWPIVFGEGGAVRLNDRRRLVECDGVVTGVALSLDRGIIYSADRRLFDAGSGEFIGSASLLEELDASANADLGTLVFTRDLGDRTEVGLMTPEGHEVDAFHGTLTVDGGSASLRIFGSRVFVCTEVGVFVLGVAPGELRLLKKIEVQGALAVGVIASNYLAICGKQGREMYRISVDRGGDSDTHFRKVRATSQMSRGQADRLGITIPTTTGMMRYEYGGTIDSSSESEQEITIDRDPTDIAVLGWSTTIENETGDMIILDDVGNKVDGLNIRNATTVVAISGNFWFGTDSGIVIFGPDHSGKMAQLGSIPIAGPIVQLVPQFNGSAAFVSASGFVGLVEPTYDLALEQ